MQNMPRLRPPPPQRLADKIRAMGAFRRTNSAISISRAGSVNSVVSESARSGGSVQALRDGFRQRTSLNNLCEMGEGQEVATKLATGIDAEVDPRCVGLQECR